MNNHTVSAGENEAEIIWSLCPDDSSAVCNEYEALLNMICSVFSHIREMKSVISQRIMQFLLRK